MVRLPVAHALAVLALADSGIVIHDTLVSSEGTVWRNGHWTLRSGTRVEPRAPDSPIVGVTRERILLGLDRQGNLRIEKRDSATGLVYLILPVHIRSVEAHRFRRLFPPGGADQARGTIARVGVDAR